MKSITKILLLLFIAISGCKKTYITQEVVEGSKTASAEYLITDYGAKDDGKTDCAAAINSIIASMPASGGTIVIPAGDFLLNAPIIINKNFVTIRGLNAGLRSNVDVPPANVQNPGGGSKLLLGSSNFAISVPTLPDVNGLKNRISGLIIKNLLISGGTSTRGTGINIQQDADGTRIEDVVGINLNTGIIVNAADAMIIRNCWVSECKNSIEMTNGIQNMISNCQLGAQPGGITVKLTNQENFIFSNNHVYPDGDVNLQLNNSDYGNITGNNFQSYYVGLLELNESSNNLVSGNVTWLRLPGDRSRQLRGKDNDYGVFRISGNYNLITNNTITADWADALAKPVTIRSAGGTSNRYDGIKITDITSPRVFFVNESSEIFNCVPAANVFVDGNVANVYIKF
ncbi:glycosyl hydrolase family 28-related protein [Mucilaginibacter sp.]|uniref:glycosyl hydrolase family 28-related protein n=1 Tax=Mucilaginibacter sp. TaxID=1882438 RepID=UPI0032653679